MSDLSDALNVTAGALKTQAKRLRHVAENISNADTPGYHRKMITFRTETDPNGLTMVRPGDVELDRSDLKQVYDPAHPLSDDTGHYEGSNVDMMIEIADAREAQRSYEANLKIFDQSRQMSSGLMELLRK